MYFQWHPWMLELSQTMLQLSTTRWKGLTEKIRSSTCRKESIWRTLLGHSSKISSFRQSNLDEISSRHSNLNSYSSRSVNIWQAQMPNYQQRQLKCRQIWAWYRCSTTRTKLISLSIRMCFRRRCIVEAWLVSVKAKDRTISQIQQDRIKLWAPILLYRFSQSPILIIPNISRRF